MKQTLLISFTAVFLLGALGRCASTPKPGAAQTAPGAPPSATPTPAVPPPVVESVRPSVPAVSLPVVPFSDVPEPRLDVSLATDRPSAALGAGEWIVKASGTFQRRRGPLSFASRPAGSVPLFVVQAGVFTTLDKAQAERLRISAVLPIESSVAESAGRFALRIGLPAERKDADALLARVRREAVPDAFLVGAALGSAPSPTVLLTSAEGTLELASPLEIASSDGSPVPFGDSSYRGHFIVRATGRGTLHAINRVGLEDYLKGVVPGEMGPKVFDELEALKAQTVAARSYALRRRGEFGAEGYDLCATPRCQVYGGTVVEQPLTNTAVEETAGEVLTFRGRVADTLFTSTCGGRTENVGDVFPSYLSQDTPYLASVMCWGETGRTLTSPIELPAGERSLLAVRGRALLTALGHTGRGKDEVRDARNALRQRLGLPEAGSAAKSLAPSAVYTELVEDAGFGNPMLLVEPSELEAAPAAWPAKARASLAVLLRFQVGAGARLPVDRPLRDEEVAGLWATLLTRLSGFEEAEGRFISFDPAGLTLKHAKGRTTYALASHRVLFRGGPDAFSPVRELVLHPGDRVRLFVRNGSVAAVTAVSPSASSLFERESTWVHWIRRFTGTELAAKLRERDATRPGTRVTRIEVLSRGASGRAKAVRVTTDRGSQLLNGLEIRFSLAIPELLFNVTSGKDEVGEPVFTFFGRGWGHGIGMCQNGAFGMALAGRTYRDILAHYYPGSVMGSATDPGIAPSR
ncbi:MAG: SpoIID/LytB domain-containing protein [Thermoanaerobaculia bacterium]